MRVETAIKMIENHGHKAFVTSEGLACVSEVHFGLPTKPAQSVAFLDDDCVFEEVTTFPINMDAQAHLYTQWADGRNVDANAIRNWLGY